MQQQNEMQAGDSIFKLAKLFTDTMGYWPLVEHSSKTRKFFYDLFGGINKIICYLTTFQYLLYILGLLIQNDFVAALERIQFFLACFIMTSKFLMIGQKSMVAMIREAIEWGNANSKEYNLYAQSSIKYCYSLSILVVLLNTIASVGYALMTKLNLDRLGLIEAGRLLIISWYPIDTEKYAHQIIWLDAIRASHMCLQNVCTYTCFNTIMIDCVAKLKVIKNKFATFHVDENSGVRDQKSAYLRLTQLIKEHQYVIGYVSRLNESIKYFLMIEYNITSILVATALFQIFQGRNLIFYVPGLVVVISQLLVLCWNANEIYVHSLNMGDGVYNSAWYLYDKNARQAVQRVIIQAQRPLSLTNGPLGPLRADSGVEVLKLAYSFMSIISATRS